MRRFLETGLLTRRRTSRWNVAGNGGSEWSSPVRTLLFPSKLLGPTSMGSQTGKRGEILTPQLPVLSECLPFTGILSKPSAYAVVSACLLDCLLQLPNRSFRLSCHCSTTTRLSWLPFASQVKVKLYRGLRDLRARFLHKCNFYNPHPRWFTCIRLCASVHAVPFQPDHCKLQHHLWCKTFREPPIPSMTSRPTSTVRLIILSCIVNLKMRGWILFTFAAPLWDNMLCT